MKSPGSGLDPTTETADAHAAGSGSPPAVSLPLVYAWARPAASRWWIFGSDGLEQGGVIAIRLLGFVTAFALLLATTGTRTLVQAAGRLDRDLGVMLALAVIPVLK